MTLFKRKIVACVAICITAILGIAVCGCDDLGAYDSTTEYYDSFGKIVFLGGAAGNGTEYSVEDFFYNEKSREDFLVNDDGKYMGVEHSDYVYVAIPFNKAVTMDSLAMYIQATNDVTVYMNVYLIDEDELPTNWEKLWENDASGEESEKVSEEVLIESYQSETAAETADESINEDTEEQEYDDPDPKTSIGEITVHLKGGKWSSFLLDYFKVNDNNEKSISVESGQYILIQIRNNSGVRDLKNGLYVDPQTGLELDKAEITMTNLLVRALEIENNTEAEEEEE